VNDFNAEFGNGSQVPTEHRASAWGDGDRGNRGETETLPFSGGPSLGDVPSVPEFSDLSYRRIPDRRPYDDLPQVGIATPTWAWVLIKRQPSRNRALLAECFTRPIRSHRSCMNDLLVCVHERCPAECGRRSRSAACRS
jgi:hypothetical protein